MQISSLLGGAAADLTSAYHPLPEAYPFCVVIPNFLTKDECQRLVEASAAHGFANAGTDYPPSYRNNQRLVIDDAALARLVMNRLGPVLPADLALYADSVNERFRFCRYQPAQQFNIHQDGVHYRGDGRQSRLTLMVYLSDGSEFEGGDTVFFENGPGSAPAGQLPRIIGRVRPQAGSLILFDHALWHAGEVVTSGVKYIMRSDVLYRRPEPVQAAPLCPFQPGHRGYVWTLASLDDGSIVSGGRDTSIRVWSPGGVLLSELHGHDQSVLGLAALEGGRLVSVSRDRTLRLWDMASGRCEKSVVAHDAAVLSVADVAGHGIATGGADGQVKLWDYDCRIAITGTGHTGWVWAVAELKDGQLVSASEDGQVIIWAAATVYPLHVLRGTVPLRTMAIADDGNLIITGDIEGNVVWWEPVEDHWCATRTLRAHSAAIRRIRILKGAMLATAGEDNYLRIWRMDGFELVNEIEHENFVTDVIETSDGYLSCSYDGTLRLTAEE